jgi:hypothetical protein
MKNHWMRRRIKRAILDNIGPAADLDESELDFCIDVAYRFAVHPNLVPAGAYRRVNLMLCQIRSHNVRETDEMLAEHKRAHVFWLEFMKMKERGDSCEIAG